MRSPFANVVPNTSTITLGSFIIVSALRAATTSPCDQYFSTRLMLLCRFPSIVSKLSWSFFIYPEIVLFRPEYVVKRIELAFALLGVGQECADVKVYGLVSGRMQYCAGGLIQGVLVRFRRGQRLLGGNSWPHHVRSSLRQHLSGSVFLRLL